MLRLYIAQVEATNLLGSCRPRYSRRSRRGSSPFGSGHCEVEKRTEETGEHDEEKVVALGGEGVWKPQLHLTRGYVAA